MTYVVVLSILILHYKCCINRFSSLCKNLSNLLEFLAEAFQCHVLLFQCLSVPVELATMLRFLVVGIAEMLLWLLCLIVSKQDLTKQDVPIQVVVFIEFTYEYLSLFCKNTTGWTAIFQTFYTSMCNAQLNTIKLLTS